MFIAENCGQVVELHGKKHQVYMKVSLFKKKAVIFSEINIHIHCQM